MNASTSTLRALLLAALLSGPALGQQQANQQSHSSSDQSSMSKSVTVTSDGNRTVKKTVITRNGVKEVFTEITDANGNVTTSRTGGDPGAKPAAPQGGPWLGIRVKEVSEALRAQLGLSADQGVLIDVVAPESPAAKAGIQKGDLLLSVGEEPIASPAELAEVLGRYETGATIELKIMRQGKREKIEVTLAPRPARGDQPPAPDGKPGAEAGGNADANGGGQFQLDIDGGDLGALLNDPNIPEDFKQTIRDMQRRMEEFQRRHVPNQAP